MKTVSVISGGFSGIAAACYAALQGYRTTVFEKNQGPCDRVRRFDHDGFLFDMDPSWHWMPDIFERFFNDFGYLTSDYFKRIKLDPAFQIFFGNKEKIARSLKNNHLKNLFYAGQLTVPRPGVPPALIPGKIAAGEVNDYLLNG